MLTTTRLLLKAPCTNSHENSGATHLVRVGAELQVQRGLQLLAAHRVLRLLPLQLVHAQVQVPNDLVGAR